MYAEKFGLYSLPGGGIDDGEDVLTALKREILEETGCTCGSIAELGMDPKDYWWYLELRKYGGVKHAGYGLGFERLIMYITGMSNIRDVEAFPRTLGNAEF